MRAIESILLIAQSGWFWAALFAVNLLTFMTYGMDKARARSGAWRTSEANLLLLAMIGGTPAAYAACHYFRHKTAKKSFQSELFLVALVQTIIVAALLAFAI
mgnify:FL=1